MQTKNRALVVFGSSLPQSLEKADLVIANLDLQRTVEEKGFSFLALETFTEPGSIYEASTFLKELSQTELPNGEKLSKSFTYKGYELWWIHYNNLFHYHCLPFIKYRKLLTYLKDVERVSFFEPPHKNLFENYLDVYGHGSSVHPESKLKTNRMWSFGIFLQTFLTIIFLPILIIRHYGLMVFTGDKFEKGKDHDFRMRYIYEELRARRIPFFEMIRSLEPSKKLLPHVFTRKRAVCYSEAITFLGSVISLLSGGRRLSRAKYGRHVFSGETDPDKRFKLLIASNYLQNVYDDIWGIRLMRWIIRLVGVRAAFFSAATERNYLSFLACKMLNIPTVGILHGVASRYYNTYDFTPGYEGAKRISVDKYVVWSDWWKEYYVKNSDTYEPDQIFVSGLMRPLAKKNAPAVTKSIQDSDQPIKVLFVPGELSDPNEIMPYILELLEAKGITLYLTFRPYRDGFEMWVKKNNPALLQRFGEDRILLGDIHDAIAACDITVGTYSTAVLESLLQRKPLTFYYTNKWGDYFEMESFKSPYKFFAKSPSELVTLVKENARASEDVIMELQKRYFGDPYKNGSRWVVEELMKELRRK